MAERRDRRRRSRSPSDDRHRLVVVFLLTYLLSFLLFLCVPVFIIYILKVLECP